MTFKPAKNPGRNSRKPRSEAQNKAAIIFRLRGMWHNSFPLGGDLLARYRALIDEAIVARGAEPEAERDARKQAAWQAEMAAADADLDREFAEVQA